MTNQKDEAEIIMLWAACTTCFFGFMRSGEVAVPSRNSFGPSYHLALEVLVVNSCESSTSMQLTLKGSKTDWVKITVRPHWGQVLSSSSNDGLCGNKGEQQTSSGAPMTRPYFVGKVMEVLSLAAQSFAAQFLGGSCYDHSDGGNEDLLIQTWVAGEVRPLYYIHQNSKGQATAYVLQTAFGFMRSM